MPLLKYLLFLLFWLSADLALAQDVSDSQPVRKVDTARPRTIRKPVVRKPILKQLPVSDTASRVVADTTEHITKTESVIPPPPPPPQPQNRYRTDTFIYAKHPFYKFTDPVRFTTSERKWKGMEGVFYAIIGLLIFFAILRNAFPKYLSDLFRLYFRATLKQRQIREQLMQAAAPSLLLNILFFISGGLYVTLLFQHFGWAGQFGFWILLVYAITALLVVYLVKFLVLKICGWIFRVGDAADAYIFIVFTNNKILGILLLGFDLFLAFTKGLAYEIAFTLSIIVVGGLFVYRFFIAYTTVQRQLKINFFHFLVYLAAFELAPLLLINKLLLKYIIERS